MLKHIDYGSLNHCTYQKKNHLFLTTQIEFDLMFDLLIILLQKTCFLNRFIFHFYFCRKACIPKKKKKKSHFIAIAIVFTSNGYYCLSTICSIAYLTYGQENPWKEMQLYGISFKPRKTGKKLLHGNEFLSLNVAQQQDCTLLEPKQMT